MHHPTHQYVNVKCKRDGILIFPGALDWHFREEDYTICMDIVNMETVFANLCSICVENDTTRQITVAGEDEKGKEQIIWRRWRWNKNKRITKQKKSLPGETFEQVKEYFPPTNIKYELSF